MNKELIVLEGVQEVGSVSETVYKQVALRATTPAISKAYKQLRKI